MNQNETKRLRIGTLNRGVAHALGARKGQVVALAVDESVLDDLAASYPDRYLSLLESVSRASQSQIAFRQNGDNADVLCLREKDEGLFAVLLTVSLVGGVAVVSAMRSLDGISRLGGVWKMTKSESRKLYSRANRIAG